MARAGAWRDQDGVEVLVECRLAGVAREVVGGGTGDTARLMGREGGVGLIQSGAIFDLDEEYVAAAARDEVNLAKGRFVAAGEYAVAMQHQPGSRDPFRASTGAVSGAADGVGGIGAGWRGLGLHRRIIGSGGSACQPF